MKDIIIKFRKEDVELIKELAQKYNVSPGEYVYDLIRKDLDIERQKFRELAIREKLIEKDHIKSEKLQILPWLFLAFIFGLLGFGSKSENLNIIPSIKKRKKETRIDVESEYDMRYRDKENRIDKDIDRDSDQDNSY